MPVKSVNRQSAYIPKIAVFDDASHSRMTLMRQLMRDERVSLVGGRVFASPSTLVDWVRQHQFVHIDIFIVDDEYNEAEWSIESLVSELETLRPNASVVCLTQTGRSEMLERWIGAKVDGILHKDDVSYGLTSVLPLAGERFIYSDSVERQVRTHNHLIEQPLRHVPTWKIISKFSTKLAEYATLDVLEGLAPKTIATVMDYTSGTVAQNKQRVKHKLEEAERYHLYDLEWMAHFDVSTWPAEKKAYHMMSSYPATALLQSRH